MSRKQAFIDGIVNAVANFNVGYSQGAARSTIAALASSPSRAVDADCSSLIAFGLWRAGYTGSFRADAWTGNLRGIMTAAGFTARRWSRGTALHAGDVLLLEGATGKRGHVALYADAAGRTSQLFEAWLNELGGTIGGAPGDQGDETRMRPYVSHPDTVAGRWEWVLTPPAEAAASTTTAQEDFTVAEAERVIAHVTAVDGTVKATSQTVHAEVLALREQVSALAATVKALTANVNKVVDALPELKIGADSANKTKVRIGASSDGTAPLPATLAPEERAAIAAGITAEKEGAR
ncbi:endolysin-like domain-containing protein [Actinomyces howellii]|uniref:NlpC/P60 domain-containing protein n=1 Tax=Actinomyces howellii TaxID=52771 RepID=A0A3S4RWI3_9ACTO|nr:hypothetical protein [Actinomyces howellii]VEG28056.1 Uncharacterised protein [Actinomyces howellii]